MSKITKVTDSELRASVRKMGRRVLARKLRHIARSLMRCGGFSVPHARNIASAARRVKGC